MTNGKRVSRDARDVTRQVIAGLSQALSGGWVAGCVMGWGHGWRGGVSEWGRGVF